MEDHNQRIILTAGPWIHVNITDDDLRLVAAALCSFRCKYNISLCELMIHSSICSLFYNF